MGRLLAACTAVGVAAVVAAAAADERDVAFEVGLPAIRLAADLGAGEEACRDAIDAPVGFERVRLVTGSFGGSGPALRVVVRSTAGRHSGGVAAGYGDNRTVEAVVGNVPAGAGLEVCVRNEGPGRVALFGVPPDTPVDRLLDPGFQALPAIVFVREPSESMLALAPTAFERGGLFKPIEAWLLWTLLAIVVLGVPAALGRALASASKLFGDAGSGAIEDAPAEHEDGDGNRDRHQHPGAAARRGRG
jgi:hypothetical protein